MAARYAFTFSILALLASCTPYRYVILEASHPVESRLNSNVVSDSAISVSLQVIPQTFGINMQITNQTDSIKWLALDEFQFTTNNTLTFFGPPENITHISGRFSYRSDGYTYEWLGDSRWENTSEIGSGTFSATSSTRTFPAQIPLHPGETLELTYKPFTMRQVKRDRYQASLDQLPYAWMKYNGQLYFDQAPASYNIRVSYKQDRNSNNSNYLEAGYLSNYEYETGSPEAGNSFIEPYYVFGGPTPGSRAMATLGVIAGVLLIFSTIVAAGP